MRQNLLSLRKEIDKIDSRIVDLISKRLRVAEKVAYYKKKNKLGISDPKREKEVINIIRKLAKNKKINEKIVEKMFKMIINESKKAQKRVLQR